MSKQIVRLPTAYQLPLHTSIAIHSLSTVRYPSPTLGQIHCDALVLASDTLTRERRNTV